MAKSNAKGERKADKKSSRKKVAAAGVDAASPKVSKGKSAEAVVGKVKKAAVKVASNPAVTEIVAATLVAAAAAIKNPQKARAMADAAADELKEASKTASAQTGQFWQLALDIARRSVEAIAAEKKANKAKSGKKAAKKSK